MKTIIRDLKELEQKYGVEVFQKAMRGLNSLGFNFKEKDGLAIYEKDGEIIIVTKYIYGFCGIPYEISINLKTGKYEISD